jgi:hypothetical protein
MRSFEVRRRVPPGVAPNSTGARLARWHSPRPSEALCTGGRESPVRRKLDAPGPQTAVIHAGTSRGDWSPVVEGREPATTIVRRRTERVSTITRDLANSAAASAGKARNESSELPQGLGGPTREMSRPASASPVSPSANTASKATYSTLPRPQNGLPAQRALQQRWHRLSQHRRQW